MLFREAKAVLLNKIDLIPYTNFNHENFTRDLKKINGKILQFDVSCTRGDGLEEWKIWITDQISHLNSKPEAYF
jgi:hydrogenase nickel incorporation protein HypB